MLGLFRISVHELKLNYDRQETAFFILYPEYAKAMYALSATQFLQELVWLLRNSRTPGCRTPTGAGL